MNDLSSLLWLLLRKLPLVLVLLAGLGFAVIRWKQHPRASLFASIGIVLYIIEIFVMATVYQLLPGQLSQMHFSMSTLFSVIRIVEDFFFSGILILLVTAAFSERTPKLS